MPHDNRWNAYSTNDLAAIDADYLVCYILDSAGRARRMKLPLARGLAVTERGGWPTGVLSEGMVQFASTDSAKLQPPNWLVPGWLGRDHLTLLIGDGDAGKSTLATDLAVALASGQTWMGVPAKQSRVMYLDEDGARPDIINRILAFRAGRNVHQIPLDDRLLVHPASGLSIESDTDFANLVKAAKGIDLMIFDAMVAFHGQDENAADKMRLIMRGRFRRLMRETEAAILLLHHIPGPDENGQPRDKPRGSTEIRNSCDAILTTKAADPAHVLKVKRCKFARKVDWAEPVNICLEATEDQSVLVTSYATKTASCVAFLSGCADVLKLTVDQASALLAQTGLQVARETAWKALNIAQSRARSASRNIAPNEASTERVSGD